MVITWCGKKEEEIQKRRQEIATDYTTAKCIISHEMYASSDGTR
jgi:hypothetical protein